MTNGITPSRTGAADHADSPESGTAGAAGGRSPWAMFSVLALIEFMAVMDASVVNIALPAIRDDLGFSPTGLAWVVDAYLLGFAGFLLLAGRASDVIGRRRLFAAGVALFTVASLACGLAADDWQLVVSRLLQGLGAALVTPAALALITDIFPEGPERNKALGLFMGMGGVAAPVGLVLGGLLTTAGWEWIFMINVPIGIGILLAALRLLPATGPQTEAKLDVIGAVTATAGLVMLILAVSQGGAQGWGSAATLAEFAAAAVLLVGFVVRQRTAADPVLPSMLLRMRPLVIGNVAFALVGTLLISTFFIITIYLQQVLGYGPAKAGLSYVPIPLAMLAGTQVAPRVLRFGPQNVLMGGVLIQGAALAAWATVIDVQGGYLTGFLLPAVFWSFGLGVSIVSSFVVCTMGLTGPIAGAGSGLATTSYQAGGAIGLAALVAVAAARTHSASADQAPLEALLSGYQLALWCSVGVALLAALLTRFIRFGGQPQEQGQPS
ncbi:MFS transporter [Streptomyces sp. NBC_00335]|uniref:MFS transporter n=1 Tax=unclassified Streptomyces TaxID=2593676 RepID=UPI00224C9FF2|nr:MULTISPECIES: MFS transporter [unclassified Streptomyces]MCX5405563.1 MFS transporter [Streptomyces sp. NBC_00086]